MLRFLKSFFGKQTPPPEEVPYKVEAPVVTPTMVPPEPAKCGCGRSQSGLCVGLHKLTPEQWAVHEANPNAVKPAEEPKKPGRAKKPAQPKTTVKATPAPKKPGRKSPAKN